MEDRVIETVSEEVYVKSLMSVQCRTNFSFIQRQQEFIGREGLREAPLAQQGQSSSQFGTYTTYSSPPFLSTPSASIASFPPTRTPPPTPNVMTRDISFGAPAAGGFASTGTSTPSLLSREVTPSSTLPSSSTTTTTTTAAPLSSQGVAPSVREFTDENGQQVFIETRDIPAIVQVQVGFPSTKLHWDDTLLLDYFIIYYYYLFF